MGRWIVLLIGLTAAAAGRSQAIPDTTAPWTYYPLGVGDEWQYQVEVYVDPNPKIEYQRSDNVTGFETIEGVVYAVVSSRTYNVPVMSFPPLPSWTRRIRFDTLLATPIGPSGDPHEDTEGCRLDEPFPARPDTLRAAQCPNGIELLVGGGYAQPLPFGGSAPVKVLRRPIFSSGVVSTTFAAGIGVLVRADTNEFLRATNAQLRYARVAGVEYGTPIVVTEEAPPAGQRALRVEPNPSDGRATVSFHMSEAGRARLSLHDVLGREVLVAYDGWLSAGDHRMPVDAAGLPPGVYLVRGVVDAIGTSVPVVVR
jgi:hypothetical protein